MLLIYISKEVELNFMDYLVHFYEIFSHDFKTFTEGAAVSFIVGQGKKGLQAEKVEVL